MSEFPNILRRLRRRYFYKQAALAAACECSNAHISWLEAGKRCPSCMMLRKLKNALEGAGAPGPDVADLIERGRAALIEIRFSRERIDGFTRNLDGASVSRSLN